MEKLLILIGVLQKPVNRGNGWRLLASLVEKRKSSATRISRNVFNAKNSVATASSRMRKFYPDGNNRLNPYADWR
jgi:hypothetical protein